MGTEIEKKFLLANNDWRELASGTPYCQGYLNREKGLTVRVRIIDDRGVLTIKGPSQGASRQEFEYEIPVDEAREMLEKFCLKPFIEKTRYKIEYAGFTWEVDEFKGDNEGLAFAEIELDEEGQDFEKPPWIGTEVTGDSRYYNANLVHNP
ncbi:MAG: CYTH domain-containing protein, partial [Desulforhopalus sp.]